MNISVKYGLISGVIIITLYLLFYLINPKYYFEFGLSLMTYLINIGFMVYVVHQIKLMSMGNISFQKALSSTFIIVVISNFLFMIFDYIIKEYVNTDMPILQMEYGAETAIRLANFFGAKLSESEQEQMYDAIYDIDNSPSLLFTIIAYFQTLFKGFIGALIVSLIMKNERKTHF